MNKMKIAIDRLAAEHSACAQFVLSDEMPNAEVLNAAFTEMADMFQNLIDTMKTMEQTVELSDELVDDIMPQVGKLVIQRYDNLNTLCMNLTELTKEVVPNGT